MHHVKPRSQGGTKVKPLCFRCHSQIHGLDREVSISELTRKALREKVSNGEHVGGVPLGFDVVGGILKPNEEEMATLDRVDELLAEGYTLRLVAAILTEEGYQTKRGGKWHPQTIKRLQGRFK